MKKKQSDIITILGIGAFGFLSILEFCSLLEYTIENLLIVNKIEPILIIWLPKIISLILFTIILVASIMKVKRATEINTRKVLLQLIIVYFLIFILQFLSTYYITDYLIKGYQVAFDSYIKGLEANYELQPYIAAIPLLKYVILAVLLLSFRTTESDLKHNK